MAFPSIRSSALTNGSTASATPVVNLPGTIRAGDTLVVYFKNAAAGAITWPGAAGDWNELVDASPDGSVGQIGIAWRKADGTEGATITLGSGNGKFVAIARAVRDAADPTLRPPELSTVAIGTTGEPDATTCTPTGGAKDYLWDTFFLMEGEQTGITSYPANHTLDQTGLVNSGTAGAVTTNATAAAAARQLNAASLDAGVWDVTGTLDDSSAYTIAFHPAEPIPAPLHMTERGGATTLPLPMKALSVTALTIASAGLALTTPVQAVPFVQTDWPVPQRRPAMLPTIQIEPADEQPRIPAQTDWPIPQGKPWPIELRTWAQGPQTSALATQPPPPIAQRDWPLPPAPSSRLVVTVDSQEPAADTVPGTPLTQREWTLPRSRPFSRELLATSPSVNLLEHTLSLAPAPVRPLDWPLPAVPARARALLMPAVNLLAHTLAAPPAPPLAQRDWPLPPRPAPRTPFLSCYVFYYALDDTKPIATAEWPTIWRPRVFPLPTITVNLLEHTLGAPPAPQPFGQTDWPRPRGREYPIGLRTWIDGRKIFHVDESPLVQRDWPLPAPRPSSRELRTWVQNLLEHTLSIAPGPKPFAQTEWPLPRGREYPIGLRTWIDGRKIFHVDASPLVQRDWPLPAARPSARELRTWTQNLLASTLAPASLPFAQTDWPIPRAGARAIDLRIFSDIRELLLVDLKPFAQTDWPIPAPPKVHPQLRAWVQSYPVALFQFIQLAAAYTVRVPEWPQTILVVETPQIIVVPEWPDDVEIP